MRKAKLSSVLLVLVAVFVTPAAVQAQTASITGTVNDATGAVVPSVTVTARNTQTNAVRSTWTGDAGDYRITALVPGAYDVVFDKSGFRTVRYEKVVLTVGQILTLDVKVEVSAVAQTIEVSGQSIAPIDLDNAQISTVVDSRRITELPLIVRDPYQLVLLAPGVIQSNSGLGGFSVNGSRERNNNFLLDGVDNNDTEVPGIPGGITTINPDATQEFRVITNNFLPEFGRNTGAIIDIVTKGGTNDLHGNAYWFGRYAALAARDFFNPAPAAKAPFVRNAFGASAGGPLHKDRTFWFANYEGQRFRTSLVNTSVVPIADFKTGFFTFKDSTTGNVETVDVSTPTSPSNRFGFALDPTIQKILALYPAPNGAAIDSVRGLFRFNSPSVQGSDNATVRVDHHFSNNHTLTGRYTFNRFEDPNPFHSDFLPGLGNITTFQRTQNLSTNFTSTFRPNLINEFRFGGNRTNLQFGCGGVGVLDSFGGKDAVGRGREFSLPGLNGFDCSALGDSNGQARFTGTYTWADSVTVIHRRHTYKIGTEFRAVYSNSFTDFSSRASLDFSNLSNFGRRATNDLDPSTPGVQIGSTTLQNMIWSLFGAAGIQSQSQFFNKAGTRTGDDLRGFRQREARIFAQDAWKVAPHLTLSYGLAWAFYGVPFEVNDNFSALLADPSGPAPFTFQIVGRSRGPQLFRDDLKNWEPRIGIAWDPFKNGKTSIRAGYGIFHDRLFGNLFVNARGNPPFQEDLQSILFNFAAPGSTPTLATLAPPPTQVASATVADGTGIFPVLFQQNFRVPYNQAWNFGVQHELFRNLTIETNYVATKGNRLFRVVDGNPPQPALVNSLVAFCSAPNAFGCTPDILQFINLWFGFEFGALPFNAVNNNALFQAALNTSQALSNFHSLQLKVTKQMSHGFQIQGAYTWSHLIDNASDPLVPASGNRAFPRNSFHLERERGNSDFDVRHRLVINYIYEFPLGRGRAHWHNGFVGRLFEGWQVSGITTFSSGIPYDIFGNVDNQHTGLSDRASLVGDPAIPAGLDKTHTGPPLSAFALTPFNQASNLGRNVFVGPGINTWNLNLMKTTSITDRFKLDLRTEFYNLLNRVQFDRPGNRIANPGTFGISTAQVGQPDGTSGARQIQFALKLNF